MNTELQQFVRDALQQGIAREKIRAALAAAHWRPEEIDAALASWAESDLPVPVPRRRTQLSAREAFLYLVLFATLYIFAFNVGAALFQLIDRWLPDAAARTYYYGASALSGLRWATAGILIAFPVYLFASRLIGRELAREPEKRASGIRRWLTYLTLFIAALVLIGNFVALLSGLLSGELTTRFLLKSAVVFAIAATVFGHYLGGLRREEADGPAAPLRTGLLGRAGAVATLAVAIAGLVVVGSPQRARMREIDQRRIAELRAISSAVDGYLRTYGRIPATLEELESRGPAPDDSPQTDPVTHEPYAYEVVDSLSYRLCATFATADSIGTDDRPSKSFWRHPAGRHCFTFHVPPRVK